MRSIAALRILLFLFIVSIVNDLHAQVKIAGGSTMIQTFDTIGTTATASLPVGWKADKVTTVRTVGTYSAAGTTTGVVGAVNISTTASNGIYNFGTSSTSAERAVGGLSSGSASQSVNVYVDLLNNSNLNIPSFNISYNVEKYRNGSNSAGFSIQLYYSTDGNNWTSAGSDFTTTFAANADNSGFAVVPGSTVSVTNKTLSVSVPGASHLYLAWNYSVASGTTTTNAQALGIDDVMIKAASGLASTNADLSALAISSGTLTPAFSNNNITYTASVTNTVSSINVTPVTSDANAVITVNGTTATSNTAFPVTLNVGDNTIAVKVTAQDGTTTKTYTITVNKAAAPVPTLTASPLSSFGNICINSSALNSFTLIGSNLDGTDITLASVDGYQFSESQNGTFTSSVTFSETGTISNKQIFVRFSPTAVQSYNGSIIITGGSTSTSVNLAGSGVNTLASLSTSSATGITSSAASLSGTITNTGCSAITSYGFEYSLTNNFTPGTGTQVSASNLNNGLFSTNLTGLNPNNLYYFRSFATSASGTGYGDQQSFTATAVPVKLSDYSDLNYREDFSTISGWTNGFASGIGASHFSQVPVLTTGSIPNPLKVTTSSVFASGTSGGVQKGDKSIVLLSTSSPDLTTSTAFDLMLDFTGVNAGTLSFDWAELDNSTGDRSGSVRIYASTNGTTFTELSNAAVLNITNNIDSSGSITVQLPASFNNNPTTRLRFYYYNGTGGTTGSRPKIAIDNISVTAYVNAPCTTPVAPPTNLTFSNIQETSLQGAFTPSSPAANKYLVIMSENASLTSNPVDGQEYAQGDNVGDGTVIAYSAGSQFNITGLQGGTDYNIFVFAVNNACINGPKYLTADILTGTATTVQGIPTCVAPQTQPTELVLSTKTTSIDGSFASSGANEYLVVRATSPTLSALPVKGITYNIGNTIGNGTVVNRNNNAAFTATGLDPNTTYYFFVFSINSQNCTGGPVYNTTNPLTGSLATLPLSPCTAPVSQAGSLVTHAANTMITGSFNASSSADHYIVVVSTTPTLSSVPIDNTDYSIGNSIGGGQVVASSGSTSFTASNLLPSSTYYITVFAANKTCIGGTKYNTVDPLTGTATTTANPTYNVYFGNLHSHSDYSDGNKDHPGYTPADDYAYARTAECMDFLGISEHNHFSSIDNPGNIITNFHKGSVQADAFTTQNPGFLALYGMEWGVISGGGHVVVYGDGMDKLFGWESNVGGISGPNYDVYVAKSDYTGPNGLFKTVNDFSEYNTFATLAHPNNTDYNNLANVPYNLVADNAIVGTAVESGPANSTNVTYSNPSSPMFYLWYYQKMLSLGYHLGPVIDHDNHNTTFGKTTRSRTAVLAPSLTKSELVKAMREMRFYATEDCDTKVDFTINTKVMGSIFSDRNAPAISVHLSDASTSTAAAKIRIMYGIPGSGIQAIAIDSAYGSFDGTHSSLPVNSTGYYYADITNGTARIVTSPIWYTRTCGFETDTIAKACNSFSWYGTTYTSSTVVGRHFTTAAGCDSLVTLHLTINTPTVGDTSAKVCESIEWYGKTYTTSGDYTHTLINVSGCDSTLTLHLTVNPKPVVTVSADGPISFCPSGSVTLTASPATSYAWSNGATSGAITVNTTGNYSVTITDENGCTAISDPVTVYAGDTLVPIVTTENITIYLDASGKASISPSDINNGSTDNCEIAVNGLMLNKSEFNCADLGDNQVLLTVTDASGNQASAQAIVTVKDVIAPVISAPQDLSINTDVGNCFATINSLGTPVYNDNCNGTIVSNDAPTTFATGITIVTWTAIDASGNKATATQKVTVIDNEKPVINGMPANMIIYSSTADNNSCSQIAQWTKPTASDNCGVQSIVSDHESGALFPIGTTTVTFTATDINGNSSTASFTITVIDNTKPVITHNGHKNVNNDLNKCGATVSVSATATDNCSVASPIGIRSDNLPLNADYPVGSTTITWLATDINGNQQTLTQIISVTDNEKPVITCPVIPVLCYNTSGTYTIPGLKATDNCGIASITYNINGATTRSGSGTNASGQFKEGTSTITWTVTDVNGNVASCTASVFVDPRITVSIPDVFAVTPGGNANTIYQGYGSSLLQLKALVTGGSSGYTYKWTVGSSAGKALNATTTYTVAPTGTTTYYFNVKDQYGCAAPVSTKTVYVQDVRCGPKMDKVTVCTLQKGVWTTSCVSSNNVASLLNNGSTLGSCPIVTTNIRAEAIQDESATKLTVVATPNPTTDQFTIITKSDRSSGITLRVYNALGILIESYTGLPANGNIRIGNSYRPGVYFAEITQDGEKVIIKLLK